MKENNFSRTLTKRNSLYLGLSSMIGAGLFYNLAPTSKISSYSSILGLLLASTLAFANASSSAQLASLYPQTGGTYLYANKVLGVLPGNIAGIVFILGNSCGKLWVISSSKPDFLPKIPLSLKKMKPAIIASSIISIYSKL